MKYYLLSFIIILGCLVAGTTVAKEGEKGHTGMQHGQAMDKTTEHTTMEGIFKHHATTDGIRSEYQMMSLASMNMTSDKGETHHIMVNLSNADTGTPDGASRGQDETHNREWFQFVHSTRPSEEERYKWADAILPDGSVHNEDGTVINARRPPSQPTPPKTPPGSTAQDSTAGKDSGQA